MTGRFRVEVIADSSAKWSGNKLRFNDRDQAVNYADDLGRRWTLVQRWRVIADADTVVEERKVR